MVDFRKNMGLMICSAAIFFNICSRIMSEVWRVKLMVTVFRLMLIFGCVLFYEGKANDNVVVLMGQNDYGGGVEPGVAASTVSALDFHQIAENFQSIGAMKDEGARQAALYGACEALVGLESEGDLFLSRFNNFNTTQAAQVISVIWKCGVQRAVECRLIVQLLSAPGMAERVLSARGGLDLGFIAPLQQGSDLLDLKFFAKMIAVCGEDSAAVSRYQAYLGQVCTGARWWRMLFLKEYVRAEYPHAIGWISQVIWSSIRRENCIDMEHAFLCLKDLITTQSKTVVGEECVQEIVNICAYLRDAGAKREVCCFVAKGKGFVLDSASQEKISRAEEVLRLSGEYLEQIKHMEDYSAIWREGKGGQSK